MPDPPPPEGAPTELPAHSEQRARLFGMPVVYIVIIAFAILIALLAWFDIIGGSVM
jgi:hypothetical protein